MAKVMSACSRVRFANIEFVEEGLVKHGPHLSVICGAGIPPCQVSRCSAHAY